jgi:hypothetical protein
MNWFRIVTDDLTRIGDCIEFYERELTFAQAEVALKGSIEKQSAMIPGVVEHRFAQLQTIEGILESLNIDLRKLRSEKFKKLLEHYARALSSRDAQQYIDCDDEVVTLTKIINEFALVRNRYIGIIKGLETKQFQINNIVKLRAAGLEDATI